jgi:hypothetical protein
MKRAALALCLGGTANAAPPRQLTHAEIVAVGEAAQAGLQVDRGAAEACQKLPTPVTAADYLALGHCYHQAGSLGAGITMLKRAEATNARAPEVKQATLELADVYEQLGYYDKATETRERWVEKYGSKKEMIAVEQRATCIWLQLGDARAKAAQARVEAATSTKVDLDHLCDTVALIVVPPKH